MPDDRAARSDSLEHLAVAVLDACRTRNWCLATAESCTGGMVAAALTAVPGSSEAFERGYVTYSNRAKSELLGVSAGLIDARGAVSEAVCRDMAKGAVDRSQAQVALAITGIAGPTGGTPAKPVGLVYVAASDGTRTIAKELRVRDAEPTADRARVRQLAAEASLTLLLSLLGEP